MAVLRLKKWPVEPSQYAPPKTGILTEWNDERGFGFITPEGGGTRVFLHISALKQGARRPVLGELFFYELQKDERGRLRAKEAHQVVTTDEKRGAPPMHFFLRTISYCWLFGAIVPVLVACYFQDPICGLVIGVAMNSLIAVVVYHEDKYSARYQYWRIPECVLHFWELFGGWPGALFAQHKFHHKNSKISYQFVFFFCVMGHLALCAIILYDVFRNQGEYSHRFLGAVSSLLKPFFS